MARRHLLESLRAAVIGRELGQQIGAALLGRAHVGENHAQQRFVELPATTQRHRGDPQALAKHVGTGRHRTGADAADVRVVSAGRNQERRSSPFEKHRAHQGDVGKVSSSLERIVQDHRVPGLEPMSSQGRADRQRRGTEVHRNVRRLGKQLAVGGEQSARVIAPFLDVGRRAGSLQDDAHLLGNRGEQGPEYRQLQPASGGHGTYSSMKTSSPSTLAL